MDFENIEYITTRVNEEQKQVTIIYSKGNLKSEYTESYGYGDNELLELSAAAARATKKVLEKAWRNN